MLRTAEPETEILLGNKQLLGIFFVVAILLGVAFYGGYMVGKAAPAKTGVTSASGPEAVSTGSGTPAPALGETHTLPPDSQTGTDATNATDPDTYASNEPPLGTPKAKRTEPLTPAPSPAASVPVHATAKKAADDFTPEAGQQFLQVTAVGRDEAMGVAAVLRRQGFPAHAVPKPGNPKLYRVLVGPVQNAGDLSATRDSLRKTGFRDVIVQKY